MKLPNRPAGHITEAQSWRLLQSLAPTNWIVREVSERDYGIDAYIEFVSTNGDVTGELFFAQLKAVQQLTWRQSETDALASSSPSVKTSAAAYWNQLPTPVFLFVADLAEENIYFLLVQDYIRRNFDSLDNQGTITFPLSSLRDLKSRTGLVRLRELHNRERKHEQFVFHISNLINQLEAFGNFIRMNQNRDVFLEVEAERHLQFRTLHEACLMAAQFLDQEWTMESLSELYERDYKEWNDDFTPLHEKTLDFALQKIKKIFPQMVRRAIELITHTEASYWEDRDPVFFSICRSGELEWTLRRIEAEANL